MFPELIELNRIRLDEDQSYDDLAAGIGLGNASTLHRLLNNPKRRPLDRTLHKIRLFLDARRVAASKATARKRASR